MKSTRNLLLFCLMVAVVSLGSAACSRETGVEAAREDQQPAPMRDMPSVSPAEQDFMMKVSQANVAEIMMARQAMRKSTNRDVKNYANMIDMDHTKSLEELTGLMQDKKVPQSRAPAPESAQDMDVLNRLSGAEFDREYANMMVENHEKATEMFRNQSENARNPDVRKFAAETLPILEMHLEKARVLQSALFNGGRR